MPYNDRTTATTKKTSGLTFCVYSYYSLLWREKKKVILCCSFALSYRCARLSTTLVCYFKVSYCLRLLSCTSFHFDGLSDWILFLFDRFNCNCNGSMVYGSHHSLSVLHVTEVSISYDISFYSPYSCCFSVIVITVICHQLSLQHYCEYCLQLLCACVCCCRCWRHRLIVYCIWRWCERYIFVSLYEQNP